MKKIFRHNRLSFKFRLFLSVTVLFTCIALFVSLLFSVTSYENARDNEIKNSQMILERMSSQFESLYNQMDVAATSITKNSDLKKTVVNLNTQDPSNQALMMEELQKTRTIQNTLVNMMFSPSISNVLLYNSRFHYFYYTGLYLPQDGTTEAALNKDQTAGYLDTADASKLLLGPHKSPWSKDGKVVLSAIRSFSDIPTTRDTIVEVQVPYSHLVDICEQEQFRDEKQIVILDDSFRLIYPYEGKVTVLPDSDFLQIVRHVKEGSASEYTSSYAYYETTLFHGRFHILLLSNNKTMNAFQQTNILYTAIAVCLVLITSCAIIFGIISVVSKPLKQLIDYINTISLEQDTPLSLPSGSLDEFELINDSFNQMLIKLKESIKQVYEAQIREGNANLCALQAQINPHFLYNAMTSISAASEIYGSEVTTRMCQQFSSMMRYVTSGSQHVKLFEELQHTRNYLEFMKISYDGNFDYSIELPLEMRSLYLPKLTIEPLVENSFKHGFKECLPPWHIAIECSIQQEYFLIRVVDDGTGFTPEALKQFDQFRQSYHDAPNAPYYQQLAIDGLGLKNIYGRLYLYFGETTELDIQNLPDGKGCQITIKGVIHDD